MAEGFGESEAATREFKPRPADAAEEFAIAPDVLPGPQDAAVTLRKIDLRSLLRFSAGFYLFLALVAVLSAGILFVIGAGSGINDSLESFVRSLSFEEFSMRAAPVLGWTALLSLFGAAGLTLLTVLLGVIYNLVCDLTGGIRILVTPRRTKMDRDEGP